MVLYQPTNGYCYNSDTHFLYNFIVENFKKYKYLIFIMATGIVVRTISKYINKKDLDPAVIVIDENITFAISLISGHIGGGNLFTKVICDKLNIIPIITTSSDITGKIAIDTLAEKLNCNMKSLEEWNYQFGLIEDWNFDIIDKLHNT